MKSRQVKKQLKKQAVDELVYRLDMRDEEYIKDTKLKCTIQKEDETHQREYIFYSKKNDRYLALVPFFEDKKIYNEYADDLF